MFLMNEVPLYTATPLTRLRGTNLPGYPGRESTFPKQIEYRDSIPVHFCPCSPLRGVCVSILGVQLVRSPDVVRE